MGKSYRSKRHHKKHRGGEGEPIDNNSVLNMDEPAAATPAPATPAPATPVPARMANATPPAEEEKKGLMDTVKGWFGGSKTKRVRFRMTRKSKRSSAKRSATKSKRSRAKRSSRKRRSTKRKGSRK